MGKERLLEKIRAMVRAEGKISFDRFMDLALYDPEDGYYCAETSIGFDRGDYYTAPHLHPLFGTLVAKELLEMLRRLPEGPVVLIELGGGKGLLAHDVLSFMQEQGGEIFDRLDYILIERSARMRDIQRKRLSPWTEKTRWCSDPSALPSGLKGCIVSNEFFDALPTHRLLLQGEQAEEIFVGALNGEWTEVLAPPSCELLRQKVQALRLRPTRPIIIEVNLLAPLWMERLARTLAAGFLLTIDYGHLAHDLYSERRPRGTLICYFRHSVNEEPYKRIGEQDITSHVNFTDLIQSGEQAGLKTVGFTDQTHFLVGLGIAEEMEKLALEREGSAERDREFLALKQLMSPSGMGKVFKVLIQSKGVDAEGLSGLTYRSFFSESIKREAQA